MRPRSLGAATIATTITSDAVEQRVASSLRRSVALSPPISMPNPSVNVNAPTIGPGKRAQPPDDAKISNWNDWPTIALPFTIVTWRFVCAASTPASETNPADSANADTLYQ